MTETTGTGGTRPSVDAPCELVAFMAHPDDAELSCGGTLALAAERGQRAAVVDFTRGELGTRGSPELRAREAREAAEILGLTARFNLGLPDGYLEDGDEGARALVVEFLRRLRPSVVIAPPLDDHHPDHVAVARTVASAFYLAGIRKYPARPEGRDATADTLAAWRPATLLHCASTRAEVPQIVVDVSRVYERRDRAVRAYASQLHAPGTPDGPPTRLADPELLEWLHGTHRRWGFLIGASYGEAFTSPDPVAVEDPVALFGRGKWERRDAPESGATA